MGNISKSWVIDPVKVSIQEGGEGGGLGRGPELSTPMRRGPVDLD